MSYTSMVASLKRTSLFACAACILLADGASAAKEPSFGLVLAIDPLSAPLTEDIVIRGDINGRGRPGGPSRLVVRDRAGKIVFEKKQPFAWDRSPVWGLSGPRLPRTLGPGQYEAVWSEGGRRSNRARFVIGSKKPHYLTLESLGGDSPGACLLLHVYVWERNPVAFCKIVSGTKLIVDGKPRLAAEGCGIGGIPWVSGGFSIAVTTRDVGPGTHTVWAVYKDHRSNQVIANCAE